LLVYLGKTHIIKSGRTTKVRVSLPPLELSSLSFDHFFFIDGSVFFYLGVQGFLPPPPFFFSGPTTFLKQQRTDIFYVRFKSFQAYFYFQAAKKKKIKNLI